MGNNQAASRVAKCLSLPFILTLPKKLNVMLNKT